MGKRIVKISIFFMIFACSLVGLNLYGVSINKVGIIPFFIVLVVAEWKHLLSSQKLKINKKMILFIFFFMATILSAFFSILRPIIQKDGLLNNDLNFIIQAVVFYIPMILLLYNSKNKETYSEYFWKYLIIIIRFHAIFIIFQFIINMLFNVNITSVLFDQLLKGSTNILWNRHIYGNHVLVRSSGLNYDPAFASYLLICGIIFDDNKYSKYVYLMCMLFATSRTGLLVGVLIILYNEFFIGKRKINRNDIAKIIVGILLFIILLNFEPIKIYFFELIDRFKDIGISSENQSESTMRHAYYPRMAVTCLLNFEHPLNYLLGVGPRASGLAVEYSLDKLEDFFFISTSMQNTVWAIECDFADILLGEGIIGFVLYYLQLFYFIINKNSKIKSFGLAILLMGIMYNFCLITINILIFMFLILLLCDGEENFIIGRGKNWKKESLDIEEKSEQI